MLGHFVSMPLLFVHRITNTTAIGFNRFRGNFCCSLQGGWLWKITIIASGDSIVIKTLSRRQRNLCALFVFDIKIENKRNYKSTAEQWSHNCILNYGSFESLNFWGKISLSQLLHECWFMTFHIIYVVLIVCRHLGKQINKVLNTTFIWPGLG